MPYVLASQEAIWSANNTIEVICYYVAYGDDDEDLTDKKVKRHIAEATDL